MFVSCVLRSQCRGRLLKNLVDFPCVYADVLRAAKNVVCYSFGFRRNILRGMSGRSTSLVYKRKEKRPKFSLCVSALLFILLFVM